MMTPHPQRGIVAVLGLTIAASFILGLGVVAFLLFSSGKLSPVANSGATITPFQQPSAIPSVSALPSAAQVHPTFPGPLSSVQFPTTMIDYPTGWPTDFRFPFPSSFNMVDARSGPLPGGSPSGWVIKLRYGGQVQDAADRLLSLFSTAGWSTKRVNLSGNGSLIILQSQNQQERGSVIIGPEATDPNYSDILVGMTR